MGIKNARLTGKLLAIALVLGYPFSLKSVSFLGFSLGTQVLKSCLKMLYSLNALDLVQNVTFLGGATHLTKDQALWEKIFSTVVNGKVTNVLSKSDLILYLYSATEMKYSIGRNQIMDKSKYNCSKLKDEDQAVEYEDRYHLENHEVKYGHMEYRDKLFEIIEKFNLEE